MSEIKKAEIPEHYIKRFKDIWNYWSKMSAQDHFGTTRNEAEAALDRSNVQGNTSDPTKTSGNLPQG